MTSLYPDEYLRTARLQAWEEGYRRLLEQTRCSGHAQLPHGFQTADGFPLGTWIAARRIRRHALGQQWQAELEALPGWSWDPGADRWEEGFGHLLAHVQAGGSAQPLRQDCSPDGFPLGEWVALQRASRWFLSTTQHQRLDRLADWSWDPATERWNQGFRYLQHYVQRTGHAAPAQRYQAADGFPLGAWVAAQRIRRHQLRREWQRWLEALPGWTWSPLADRWEEGFGHLLEHVQAGGSAQPLRQDCSPDGFPLGEWVALQRASRWFLSVNQRQRLDRLADWSWDPATERWNQGFRYLQHYLQQTGHAAPAQRYQAADGFPLGAWVSAQRIRRHQLHREWQQWLESLPGWSWGPGSGSGSTGVRSD